VSAVLGTAGHVDHGKTTLCRHLTGIDTDRLIEEKARGISIELGFAWLDLPATPGGTPARVAVVDVPGHERFVRQMIAGAAGIDLVLLVVAADEGVMPQTREHLDICQLLGVSAGGIVITKRDLVEPDWLELVREDVREAVSDTFLAGAPVWTYAAGDARDAAGLVEGIAQVVADLASRSATLGRSVDRPAKLSVDRVFTMRGFGTVVTGTSAAGRFRTGEPVVVLPSGKEARIRGLEMHGATVPEIGPGVRCAVNLQGVEVGDIERGDVLSTPGGLRPTSMFEASFRALGRLEDPIPDRARVLCHIGTSQVQATLAFASATELPPGEAAAAQIRLDHPIAILPGEPFVVRGFQVLRGYGKTLGGGRAWMPSLKRMRGRGEDHRALVSSFLDAEPHDQVLAAIRHAEDQGLPRRHLGSLLPLELGGIAGVVERLLADGSAVDAGQVLYSREVVDRLVERAGHILDDLHEKAPARAGIPIDELRTRVRASLPPELFQVVVTRGSASAVLTTQGDLVHRPGFEPRRSPAQEVTLQAVRDALREGALTPPRVQDLPELLGKPAEAIQEALDFLVADGHAVRVSKELAFASRPLEDLETRLRSHLQAHETIDTAGFKDLTGASRKWTIPLGEHFDQKRVTLRVGDLRRLRSRE
jgi:selenocysteine-specific elongation factor